MIALYGLNERDTRGKAHKWLDRRSVARGHRRAGGCEDAFEGRYRSGARIGGLRSRP
jgi:hypothetical protein